MAKQKLELTWIGKEVRPLLEPRILLEDPALGHHAAQRISDNDFFDNRLIFGDNLLALKALEQEFTGKVKCVFIDPPYNTGSAFAHYDDGVEHSVWLSLMRDRLEIIRRLMSDEASVWISIDDNESHYLKVLCDEVFGRVNFLANVVWQKRIGPDARATLGSAHDNILVYTKKINHFVANPLPISPQQRSQYANPDNDPRGVWSPSGNFSAQGFRSNQMYKITTPGGAEYYPPEGRCWVTLESEFKRLLAEGRMWFGRDGRGMPRKKMYLSEDTGRASWTWWPNDEVGNTQESKKESIALFPSNPFETPKPERLISRVLAIATKTGDLVLDSFAGSGTTGAVAHKMGRRWIMAEFGEHCHTHIILRLKKVIDGEDSGGITEAVGWKGGGGFRYYRLAPSLLQKDRWGQWVVSPDYNADMLSAALCKLEGFTYAPSPDLWWQHGKSTERDFIYVTTQTLNAAHLSALSDDVGPDRTLLVCCGAFRGAADGYPNLTIRKIPKMVLRKCEWGHDDYSLNVANLPSAMPTEALNASVSPQAGLSDATTTGR